jgi:hypothetical protein
MLKLLWGLNSTTHHQHIGLWGAGTTHHASLISMRWFGTGPRKALYREGMEYWVFSPQLPDKVAYIFHAIAHFGASIHTSHTRHVATVYVYIPYGTKFPSKLVADMNHYSVPWVPYGPYRTKYGRRFIFGRMDPAIVPAKFVKAGSQLEQMRLDRLRQLGWGSTNQ